MNQHTVLPKRGLYLITPYDASTENFLQRVLPLLNQNIAIVQYRNKLASPTQRYQQASALQSQCRQREIVFIVNDDVDLAETLCADGVHLGEHDTDVSIARSRLGEHAMIGVSCYNSLAMAEGAKRNGADYIAFGAVFASGTKPHARVASLALFSQAAHLHLPMVAIGGITPDNAEQVLAAGAHFIAVIGAVFDAEDPALQIKQFLLRFE